MKEMKKRKKKRKKRTKEHQWKLSIDQTKNRQLVFYIPHFIHRSNIILQAM